MIQTASPRQSAPSANQPASLQTYLASLRGRAGELRTVSREVNPLEFEVTAILEHLERRREFPAVLFERTRTMHGDSSAFPILSNLWGTRERCAEMLGLPPEQSKRELGLHFGNLMRQHIPPAVVTRDAAPVQAHVFQGSQADMWMLPGVRHFEMDLGPVLTMAHVMHAPGESFYNVTFAKTFPESGQRSGLTIHTPHLSRMLRDWERRGERAPIVNILGHHPAFWLGSLSLTGYGNDDYATCGAFMREPLRLVPSVTWGSDFMVPADAEIIIEAELVPGERTVVDPFGEISRLYQAQELGPVMEVKAITHRDGAILQDVFSGHAEHFILGLIPREGSLLNQLEHTVGGVSAVHLPHSGTGRFVGYISVRKEAEGHPKQVALQAVAISPTLQTVVVVDEDVDVFSEEDVLWAVNTYVDPARDVDFIRNMGRDSERMMGNGRVLIDATRPTHIAFPSQLRVPPAAMERINVDDWLDTVP